MSVHAPHAGRRETLGRAARRTAWRASQAATRAVLRPSAPLRVLPDVLLIGAQRSGTTSLHRTLAEHPGVMTPRLAKGVHWWDARPDRSLGWYRAHFPLRAAVEQRTHDLGYRPVVLEASPYYLFHPTAPARIVRDLPGVRVVAVLRDPVARAWSHYHHEVAKGFEDRPFAQAIAEEDAALAREHDRLLADEHAVSYAHMHHGYRWRGRYAEQLERWFDAAGRHRVHVLFSDDLRTEPTRAVQGVLDFCALPPVPAVAEHRANQRDNPALDPALAARLRDEFAPHDQRLAELLGRDLPWRSS